MGNDKLSSDIQKPDVGVLVTLYQLDATPLGALNVWYFTQAVATNDDNVATGAIYFGGIEYTPIDIKAEGFDIGTDGVAPRPKISISNVKNLLASEITDYNDFLGCEVTRIRTLSKYLDGEPLSDPAAIFPTEKFIVQQKIIQNKQIIQWELTAKTDLMTLYIPGRTVVKEYCSHIYRYYDGELKYNNVTCPYAGANYFKKDGTVTTNPAEDACGKKLSDCKLRYPNTGDHLPTRAFPMVGRSDI